MTDPSRIDPADRHRLDAILAASPDLAGYIRSFAALMTELRGASLETWMAALTADDQPELHSCVPGLRHDQAAITAGLGPPWNSGAAEGHVNRIKMLKRQMFGRANPHLLRKRILLSHRPSRDLTIRNMGQNQPSRVVHTTARASGPRWRRRREFVPEFDGTDRCPVTS